jgi:Anp1
LFLVDYNSWIETDESKKATANLDRDFIIAEGYKQFVTHRKYMTLMGNWRDDKDVEMELDGIGGVSIMVKADVHRSGGFFVAKYDTAD